MNKAAGVSVACALTIGMNVVIAGPEESTLFQQMGLIKTAAGAEVTNATVAPAIAPTPISINNQKRVDNFSARAPVSTYSVLTEPVTLPERILTQSPFT